MVESGLFEYWFAYLFALIFICWFPTYVIKTKGKGLPLWGLSFAIVALFLFLPLISLSFVQDILPTVFLNHTVPLYDSPNSALIGKTGPIAFNDVYISLALICLLIGVGQAFFSAWLLYVRHNRESLFRAIRIMWCSALMQVFAVGVLPFVFLGRHGLEIVRSAAIGLGVYIAILFAVTVYLRRNPAIDRIYPISHRNNLKNSPVSAQKESAGAQEC